MCDCCDGTDEHDGRTNCANTCVQAGAARRDAIRTKVHAAKGGVDRGRKIRDAAPALRRKWMDESATLEKDVAAQRAIVHDANVAKDVAEREESDATKAEDRLNKREAARNSSSTSSSADESSPDGGAESVPHASPTPPVEPGTEDDPEFPVDDFEEDRMPDDFEEDRIPIDSPEAAELAGINTRWMTVKIFALMGFLTGIASVVASARLGSATAALGTLDELYVIAAAVIGGTSLAGGVGTIYGAILGALVMQSLQTGMVLIGFDAAIQQVVVGSVLVIAVFLDILYRRNSK